MKRVLIFFYDFDISPDSTKSISRLLGSFIREVESEYAVTYFTFSNNFQTGALQTEPEKLHIKKSDRAKQKMVNVLAGKKVVKEFHLRKKIARGFVKKQKRHFDIVIVLGLDEVQFLRNLYPASKIIYWIHGISAIYNKNYLKQINSADYLWSPTTTIYKNIVRELHPVPFLCEYQLVPNWAEPLFSNLAKDNTSDVYRRYNISVNSSVFIFCGGDLRLKGWFIASKALRTIAENTEYSFVVFVAGGVVEKEETYSGNVRVIHTGTIAPDRLAGYYQSAQFGLFPSLGGYEHAPVTLLEMIQSNVLPLASDVGGIREMLGEDYPFIIDAPHSVDKWIEKIEIMLQMDDEKRCLLLSSLKRNLDGYKKRDFKQMLRHITAG